MQTKDWGPHFWSMIHYTALGYPEIPTQIYKEKYKVFFENLGFILPCKQCSFNYNRHLRELPIDSFLENRNKLFEWTVKLHNIVNKETGKTIIFSFDQAWSKYNSIQKNNNIIFITFFLVVVAFMVVAVLNKSRLYHK
jgi:hypothetical protein